MNSVRLCCGLTIRAGGGGGVFLGGKPAARGFTSFLSAPPAPGRGPKWGGLTTTTWRHTTTAAQLNKAPQAISRTREKIIGTWLAGCGAMCFGAVVLGIN